MSAEFEPQEFAAERDNVLIAPAGFGKTQAIVECVGHCEGKQLVLTHTQAGVAALRSRFQKNGTGKERYCVETISSFVQRYVTAFETDDAIPDISNASLFYSYLSQKALEVFSLAHVQRVVRTTYSGLFVDEYQDCTLDQHNIILALSKILPAHVLGDPMQGIFGFAGTLVNLNNAEQMGRFSSVRYLTTPHRWINAGKPELGNAVMEIRGRLERGEDIDLRAYPSIWFMKGTYRENYWEVMNAMTSSSSVLVIHPNSTILDPRINFISAFKHLPVLIEAIDDKDFYKWAAHFDRDDLEPKNALDEFIKEHFTNVSRWYNRRNKKFVKKGSATEEAKVRPIKESLQRLEVSRDYIEWRKIIYQMRVLDDVKYARRDMLYSICQALEMADADNSSALEAMKKHRNNVRRTGRKAFNRSVGTTLLTKGLEFETVIILDADKFEKPTDMYVAISRCTKKLIILSAEEVVRPYK